MHGNESCECNPLFIIIFVHLIKYYHNYDLHAINTKYI